VGSSMTERKFVHRPSRRLVSAAIASISFALSAGLAAPACDSPSCFDTNQLPCVSVPAPDAGNDAADATMAEAASDAGPEASDDGSASSDVSGEFDALDAGDAFDGFDGFDGWDGFVCDPTKAPSDPLACITDASGVFVAPTGHDGAAGTMADPLLKIGDAVKMAAAGAKRVLACGGTYNEQVTIDANVGGDALALYGALDCVHGWKWSAGTPTILAPTTPGVVLTLKGVSASVTIEDFGFHALAGANAGDSSIAVFASYAKKVFLRRCDIAAGKAQDGKDPAGLQGFPMAPAGAPGSADGGAPPTPNSCNGVANASVGGGGGPPADTGADGMDGTPGTISNKGIASAHDCSITKGSGGAAGENGLGGSAGQGATTLAKLDETGWTPSAGQAGGNGTVGQGGGGGASQSLNGGGGAGGAGGCGGAGGAAGTGGGSSIGVLAYQSTVVLELCTLAATDAGRGGNGANGQLGQAFGNRGSGGGADACQGGHGGYGGTGGGGGGGAGGVSAAVVWAGTAQMAPTLDGTSMGSAKVGKRGDVGSGGMGVFGAVPGFNGTAGMPGSAAPVVQF